MRDKKVTPQATFLPSSIWRKIKNQSGAIFFTIYFFNVAYFNDPDIFKIKKKGMIDF